MKKLYRSNQNRKVAGVCGGIGELLEVDPTIILLATFVLCVATGFFPFVLGYIVAWIIVPRISS